ILRRSSRDALSITNNVFPSVRKPTPYTHHLTRSLVGVELEIDCPDRVRLGRCRRVDGRGTNAFAAPTPRDPQALLPPEPLDLLVIDSPVSPRAPRYAHRYPPRVLLRVPTKPVSCNARSGTTIMSAWSGHRYTDLPSPTRQHAIHSLTNSVPIK